MKILFVSNELIGSSLCLRLIKEGHDVKLYIHHPDRKNCLVGFAKTTKNWRKELTWVGKNGLIVFDDVGYGKEQEDLRSRGYKVFGGNIEGDKLELDRAHGQRVLHNHKVKILPSFNFININAAIDFIKENKGKWVVKQTSHISSLNLVGARSDARDIIERLYEYKKLGIKKAHLQKKAEGVEIGVARYFNGTDWVGPIEINHEYKRLKNNDTGPLTAEMGTVMWHSTDENLPLFTETLKKIKPHLQKIQFKGDIDINCIATKDDIWPLELTPRLGSPSTQLQCELYTSSFGKFLHAVASGSREKLEFKNEYGIVVCVALPPFPYPPKKKQTRLKTIQIKPGLTEGELNSIHFEEVSKKKNIKTGKEQLVWSGQYGYVLYITASAKTIPQAQKKVKNILSHILIPKMIYRTDIGDRVHKKELRILKNWGWI